MFQFDIVFTGRKIGSIGILSQFRESVIAESLDAATLTLYEKYEHISVDGFTSKISPLTDP